MSQYNQANAIAYYTLIQRWHYMSKKPRRKCYHMSQNNQTNVITCLKITRQMASHDMGHVTIKADKSAGQVGRIPNWPQWR